jgi:hypothetical protein
MEARENGDSADALGFGTLANLPLMNRFGVCGGLNEYCFRVACVPRALLKSFGIGARHWRRLFPCQSETRGKTFEDQFPKAGQSNREHHRESIRT